MQEAIALGVGLGILYLLMVIALAVVIRWDARQSGEPTHQATHGQTHHHHG